MYVLLRITFKVYPLPCTVIFLPECVDGIELHKYCGLLLSIELLFLQISAVRGKKIGPVCVSVCLSVCLLVSALMVKPFVVQTKNFVL